MNQQALPKWFLIMAHALPWGFLIYFLTVTLIDPQLMAQHIQKDHVDLGGLAENMTVIFLIPGIALGFYTFFTYRKNFNPPIIAYWLFLWSLACLYFAGEEISWGQWIFGWATPEQIASLNDQGETNFHNMSSWFDQKPRNLVELWIFITGVVFPFLSLFIDKIYNTEFKRWIHPVPTMVSAGIFYTVIRFASLSSDSDIANLFGSSEVREMAVALYLSLFLCSFYLRIKTKNLLS